MGVCWCKDKAPDEESPYEASPERCRVYKPFDSVIVDRLVLEMLSLIASFVDKWVSNLVKY